MELLTSTLTYEDRVSLGRSRTFEDLVVHWSMAEIIHPIDGAKDPGKPGYTSAMDLGVHRIICFVSRS